MASSSSSSTTVISKDVDRASADNTIAFFDDWRVSSRALDNTSTKDFYSNIIGAHLRIHKIQRGRVTCFFSVKPGILNIYGGTHGGVVAAVAEKMAIACARTVVAEDKEIFLGELNMSYLSAATENSELIVDASIVRSGKNVTAVVVDFKFKESEKLVYTCRATFYNTPVAKL
ncbi:hypothetical protein LWI28_010044 [Acer negundo]|uniref:Thioesterase domain-containing protein n=1 Tax=Acer negundo TaxID=4023 RepID=A0AAD5IYH8_ACENE|nr:hypothetical protein LWI28_010044 [Acer negundo]KAK4848229.1 hypothetical protein QYF36_010604 [Acer negundo]